MSDDNSGPLGGDQEIGAMISQGKVGAVFFFRDSLSAHPHRDLGVRYSTSLLAISANRLASRPLINKTTGRRFAAPIRCFARGRLAKRFALIANNDVE